MQQIIHTVFFKQIEQNWEEASFAGYNIFGIKNVFFQDESKDLNNFYPAYTKFRPVLT